MHQRGRTFSLLKDMGIRYFGSPLTKRMGDEIWMRHGCAIYSVQWLLINPCKVCKQSCNCPMQAGLFNASPFFIQPKYRRQGFALANVEYVITLIVYWCPLARHLPQRACGIGTAPPRCCSTASNATVAFPSKEFSITLEAVITAANVLYSNTH
jgi:hypothetical protein